MPRTTEAPNTPPVRCAAVELARFKPTRDNLPLFCPPIFNPLSRAFPFQASRHITALAPDLYQIQTSVYTPTLGNFRQFARTVKRGGQPRYSSGLHHRGRLPSGQACPSICSCSGVARVCFAASAEDVGSKPAFNTSVKTIKPAPRRKKHLCCGAEHAKLSLFLRERGA